MKTDQAKTIVMDALEDLKAVDIAVLDVKHLTSVTDLMIICSGTSARHVASIANNVIEKAKLHRLTVLGSEGEQEGEWVLVDLGDIVVHVMQPPIRSFYNLEKLWTMTEDRRKRG
ncbi:MAG: rsfS [Gammaproteobacteria bacterium]|jgi:ribosome-associated protein|nr:rsfS [Gammaproteobacteria bacterium]